MRLARPYAQKMRNVIGHLTEANPDYRHPFLVRREPRAVGLIVISTDRGLAGDRKSTRLNSSHLVISYAVFCLKKKKHHQTFRCPQPPPCTGVTGLSSALPPPASSASGP